MQRDNLAPTDTRWLSVIEATLGLMDWPALQAWINGPVQAVLPHQACILGQSVTHSGGIAGIQRWSTGLPPAYLAVVTRPAYNMRSPLFQRLIANQHQPLFFDAERDGGTVNAEWLANFKRAGWRNLLGFVHQTGTGEDALITTVAFYNVPTSAEQHADALQTRLAPLFHAALSAMYTAAQLGAQSDMVPADEPVPATLSAILSNLTSSEEALLPWLTQGKTTKEIAKLLQKSDHTVKNQLAALMRKCHAKSRTELVTLLKPPPDANGEAPARP